MRQPDPLAELRARFIARCRERITGLRTLIDGAAGEGTSVEALVRLAHQLAGAAGTFGYATLGRTAATLEDRVLAEAQGASTVDPRPLAALLASLEAQIAELEATTA